MSDVTLAVVIVTALVDAVNPCAIGVLVLLMSTLVQFKDRRKILLVGSIYVFSVFVTYLLAGFGLLWFVHAVGIASWLTIVVALIILVMGLLELKDVFWYGKGISLQIPKKQAARIQRYIATVTVPGSIVLGIFVAAVELPCTGGPYLAIMTLLAQQGFTWGTFGLLVLYNALFVLPLVVIVLLVFFGMQTSVLQNWKQENKKWMRLAIGLVLIALAVLLLLW